MPLRIPLAESLISGLAGAAFAHLIFDVVGFAAFTQGPSMLPTLEFSGNGVWVSTHYRRGRGIRVGDVISFRHPWNHAEGVSKRVVGMPGDFVLRDSPEVSRGTTKALEGKSESLMGKDGGEGEKDPPVASKAKSGRVSEMVQVPQGHCWVAGDNLPWSRDSRDYGPIPLALIRGKVTARVWPLGSFKWMKNTLENVEKG